MDKGEGLGIFLVLEAPDTWVALAKVAPATAPLTPLMNWRLPKVVWVDDSSDMRAD